MTQQIRLRSGRRKWAMENNRCDVLPACYDSSDLRLPRFRYNRRAMHVVECKTRHVRDSDQAGRANERGKTSWPEQLRRSPSQKFQKWLLYIFVNHLFVRRRFLVYPFSNTEFLKYYFRRAPFFPPGRVSLRRREKCQSFPSPASPCHVSWIGISLFGIKLVVELLRSTSPRVINN